MTYDIISTGSQGNAVVINGEILIDCGVAWRALKPYAKGLKLVLLTHIHGDHFRPTTVRALHRERPALRWGCCGWMVEPLLKAGVDKRAIDVMGPDEGRTTVQGMAYDIVSVRPEPLIHNVKNCGYTLTFPNGERVLYATDTGSIDHITAQGYDLYLIEANHTRADLAARADAKRAAGAFAYEMDAGRYHLSQEQAERWLAENAGPNSRFVFLHQHKEKEGRNAEPHRSHGPADP